MMGCADSCLGILPRRKNFFSRLKRPPTRSLTKDLFLNHVARVIVREIKVKEVKKSIFIRSLASQDHLVRLLGSQVHEVHFHEIQLHESQFRRPQAQAQARMIRSTCRSLTETAAISSSLVSEEGEGEILLLKKTTKQE